jgi:replication factor C subunit 1
MLTPRYAPQQSAVDDVIDFMDEYFLNKEDWDSMVELGVGSRRDEDILKQISSATKAAFTRKCVPPF